MMNKDSIQIPDNQMKILKNAYGFDSKKPGYRTHYCGRLSNDDLKELVKNGFLTEPQVDGTCGEGLGMYYLTPKAINSLKSLHPKNKSQDHQN